MITPSKPEELTGDNVSRFRRIFPQAIVSCVTGLLLLDVGTSVSFPTVLVSALYGLNVENNPDELLRITPLQVSWLASTTSLAKLCAGIMSGWLSEMIGRKTTMIVINIPPLISWYLFYTGTTISEIFIANVSLGFGAGLIKATSVTYIGETSEASIRGILIASASTAMSIAPLIIYFLGTLTAWRNIALYCFVIQSLIVVVLFFIPESPVWYLSKNKDERALKSLKWLRGWISSDKVESEFESMKRHKEFSNACSSCAKAMKECTHPQLTLKGKLKELTRKRTMKPFIILLVVGTLAYVTGINHLMTYFVPILNTYKCPINPNRATIVLGVADTFGTITAIFSLKFMGVRKLFLTSLVGVASMMFSLSLYGFLYLPLNSKSFDHTQNVNISGDPYVTPLILFIFLQSFSSGTITVLFTLLGELFPLKLRSFATGLMISICNVIVFVASKTFYDLENMFDLPTALAIYCAFGVIGFIISYKIVPETKGCTLEDIDRHFSANDKKLTDRDMKLSPVKLLP